MSPGRAAEGWQRNVWALALSVFIAFVWFAFFVPFLPLTLAYGLGGTIVPAEARGAAFGWLALGGAAILVFGAQAPPHVMRPPG